MPGGREDQKDVAKASSNPCATPPTTEGPLIRIRIPVAELQKMLARKRRAARRAPAPKESITMIHFHLADYFKPQALPAASNLLIGIWYITSISQVITSNSS